MCIDHILDRAEQVAGERGKTYLLGLVDLAKTYDLTERRFADVAQAISTLIHSADSQIRQDVAYALCFRPVSGYEWVAVEGWRRSPPMDLHWHASFLENSIADPSQVNADVVLMVAKYLFAKRPCRESFGPDELAEAAQDWGMGVEAANRVMTHLYVLVTGKASRIRPLEICRMAHEGTRQASAMMLDWSMVTEVLFYALGKGASV